jgi:hypothetical protein
LFRSEAAATALQVSLARFRPPIWRRVRLPVTATLADLHEVIQVLFGWDGVATPRSNTGPRTTQWNRRRSA